MNELSLTAGITRR